VSPPRPVSGVPGTGGLVRLLATVTRRIVQAQPPPAARLDGVLRCRQCDRDGSVQPITVRPGRLRYWCRSCGAVVTRYGRRTAEPVHPQAERQPAPAGQPGPAGWPAPGGATDPLLEVMPAAMVGWLHRTARRAPSRNRLGKAELYGYYANFDRFVAQADTSPRSAALFAAVTGGRPELAPRGLPGFPAVVGALHDRCYRVDRVCAALRADGDDPVRAAAVRERVEHARRWLATQGRDRCWIARPPAAVPPPATAALPALIELVRADADWTGERTRPVHQALFGVDGGPPLPRLLDVFGPETIIAALHTLGRDGSRPLRDAVLAALDGSPAPSAPAAVPPPAPDESRPAAVATSVPT
jgi:hypothetical protein